MLPKFQTGIIHRQKIHCQKSRGANSTHPHERDREAPMREARQAAPDWARASAALSSMIQIRGFLVGPSRCDAKVISIQLMHTFYGNTIAEPHYRQLPTTATSVLKIGDSTHAGRRKM